MKKRVFTSLLTLLLAISSANGSILMLDFGPTTTVGANLTNSPAHSTGAVALSNTTWNTVGTSGSLSGAVTSLSYADGSSADGVSFTWGASAVDSKAIDFTASISTSHNLGSGVFSGVYTGDSVARDGIFNGSGSGSDYSIGLRIDGLAAGDYDIYFMGRNTNTSGSQDMDLFVSSGASSDSFDYSLDTAAATASGGGSGLDSWVEGSNYGATMVSIADGDSLFLAIDGQNTGQNRGFLNALQIVSAAAVPEPSTTGVIAALFAGLLIAGRRRNSVA